MKPPAVVLFPYLQLAGAEALPLDEDWEVVPVHSYPGPWRSDDTRKLCRAVAEMFLDRGGNPVPNPSMLVHRSEGMTGEVPDAAILDRAELAVGFAVVDSVPRRSPDAEINDLAAERSRYSEERSYSDIRSQLWEENSRQGHYGYLVATSDNAGHRVVPLDGDGMVVSNYGALVRTTSIDDHVVAPVELNLPAGLSLDGRRASALFQVLLQDDVAAKRLGEAVRWFLQAWRNTDSLLVAQRVLTLRTAFEVALTRPGEHVSKERLARRLSERFEAVDNERGPHPVRAGEMLWRREDRTLDLPGVDEGLAPYNDFERWFIELSKARNGTVHGGKLTGLEYLKRPSRYRGSYWWVASRVFRDLVLVELHHRGHRRLWVSEYDLGLEETAEVFAKALRADTEGQSS